MQTFLVLATLLVFSSSTVGQSPGELKSGQWLEVRGQLQADGTFMAEKITVSPPDDEASLSGTVKATQQGELSLLQHKLAFEDDASFQGIHHNQLLGARVKVQGELAGFWTFSVEEVDARGPGRDRIEGPVDEIMGPPEDQQFTILGYRIHQTQATQRLGFGGQTHPRLTKSAAPRLFQSLFANDEIDDDDRFGSGIRLRDDLYLKTRIVGETATEDNFNFDGDDKEDRSDREISLRSRLEWQPKSVWTGVFELRYSARYRERENRRSETESDLSIGEAFISRRLGRNTQLHVGRQDFDDNREWLYDQNLDAIRLATQWRGTKLEASVSKIFSDDGSREEDANNYILSAKRQILDGSISLYYIDRKYAREHDEDSFHIGLRAQGEWLGTEQMWLDLAKQGGRRQGATINAHALDVGGTWQLGDEYPWYLTTGLAYASGDKPSTSNHEQFRQTGLQDNNGRFGGLTSFRYYGELSDPELSNLWVSTLGIGKRVLPTLSIDLVAHSYHLDEQSAELQEVEWDSDLTGISKDLGWETDMIVGYRHLERWEIEAVLGYFDPGRAFINKDAAWFAKFQLKIRY